MRDKCSPNRAVLRVPVHPRCHRMRVARAEEPGNREIHDRLPYLAAANTATFSDGAHEASRPSSCPFGSAHLVDKFYWPALNVFHCTESWPGLIRVGFS